MRRVLLAGVFAVVLGCGKKDEGDNGGGGGVAEKPPVVGLVEIQALSELYRTNEAAADEKYTGRRVTCRGYVHSVAKTESGHAMKFEIFVYDFNTHVANVRAIFPASETSSLTKFDNRAEIRFSGLCAGKNRNEYPAAVVIRDCKVLPLPKPGSKD